MARVRSAEKNITLRSLPRLNYSVHQSFRGLSMSPGPEIEAPKPVHYDSDDSDMPISMLTKRKRRRNEDSDEEYTDSTCAAESNDGFSQETPSNGRNTAPRRKIVLRVPKAETVKRSEEVLDTDSGIGAFKRVLEAVPGD